MTEEDWQSDKDYCYVCDKVTSWDEKETCSDCGRAWGHDLTLVDIIDSHRR